ncbi:GD21969 [Drosophila simulans]|uniref:GD21969 n=1 Tax=Drosophila simulans TaxID=7240 RepID=B4Q604_DROSI|nr:GD21969 [Drosophila simulans]
MHLYLVLISCLVSSSHCWQFDGGGGHRRPRNTGRGPASSSGGRGSAALLGSQQQDILYACPLNSMCQCAGLPNETSTLIEINCNEVALYKFPEFMHSSVRYIEMSNTHLQSVDDETFQGLRLKTLKLIDNELQDISERSFSTMTHSLMTLDISGNKMQHLPLDALQRLHSLSRLVAQRNHITTLDGNWDAQHDTLRSLHLSDNDITEVAPGGGSIEVVSQSDNSSQPFSLAAVQTRLETSNSIYPPSPVRRSGDRGSSLRTVAKTTLVDCPTIGSTM